MTTQIEVAQDTARMLQANAAARRVSLDDYLRSLAEADSLAGLQSPSLEEFDRDMDELAAGLEGLPVLPEDFSRADIYDDHD
ncbi:MAG: hypothetical protein AB7P14_06830 [Blastocatellales bacterium]